MLGSAGAAIATTQAAVAAQAAHDAEVAHCKTVLPTFNAQTATVSEKREYAGCVGKLYPEEMSADVTVAVKVLFVIALLGFASTWAYCRRTGSDFIESTMMGVFGFFLAPIGVGFIAAVCYGVVWLFS